MRFVYFDTYSFLLYIVIAFFCYYQLRLALRINASGIKDHKEYYAPYSFLFIVLSLFAALRSVENGIGGTDAERYEMMFINSLKGVDRFEDTDILFGWFTIAIRTITDNPIIYRFICYSIIVTAYIVFFKNYCDRSVSCIPFLAIIIPYLKSFNTMRSSIAIAVILFGLVLLQKRKTLIAIIVISISIFIHRMSVVYVLFLPFYAIAKHYQIKSGIRWITIITIISSIGYLVARKIQAYVLMAGMMSSQDEYYIKHAFNNTLLDSAVSILPLILISITWIICNNRLPKTENTKFLELMVAFDIIITPSALILGMWRANEYFYMGRLAFWAYLIPAFFSFFSIDSRKIVKTTFFIMFLGWVIYRIFREWEPCGLMPYKLIF